MKRFLIVAGEASGDIHGADLIHQTIQLNPTAQFIGLGGPKMAAAKAKILFDPMAHSATGITEIISVIPTFYPYFKKLTRLAVEQKCDAAILIDWPEFNMRLAKRLKQAGIKVIYYISPQIWGWREWRVKEIRKWVDEILVVFEFEVDFYKKHGITARFVGHPLVDQIASVKRDDDFRAAHGLPQAGRLIGLLPGSRRKEVRHIYPTMVAAAEQMTQQEPSLCFALGKSSNIPAELIDSIPTTLPIAIADGGAHQVMANADLLLIASGTATLEAAILGTPMIVSYKTSPLTYAICKPLRKTQYIALVNILTNRKIVPEFLQHQASSTNICRCAIELLNGNQLQNTSQQLLEACKALGPLGASRRAAEEVLKIVSNESDNY